MPALIPLGHPSDQDQLRAVGLCCVGFLKEDWQLYGAYIRWALNPRRV